MNKSRYLILSTFFILVTVSFGPTTATAFSAPTLPERQFPFSSIFLHLPFHTVQLCPKTITAAGISVAVFLPGLCDEIPPPPEEPEDPAEPEDPTLEFSADPDALEEGDSSTLAWEAENADTCAASEGWDGDKPTSGSESVSPTETTTYTLICEGEGGEVMQSVMVTVTPAPEPEPEGELLISEVYYDVHPDQGVETTGANNNEWVELYNGTNSDIDLSGWKIADTSTSDVIPEGVVIPAGGFLIITATTSTAGFWPEIPENVGMVVLESAIGNGLANGGDSVFLLDAEDNEIDAVSWGASIIAFEPSVPLVTEGNSIARLDLSVDTDTAVDWEEFEIPTPGAMNVVPDPE